LLIDRGYHPLAYRLMCLQAHYRSELEFSWEGLGAALTRLKRMVMAVETLKARHAEPVSASINQPAPTEREEEWTLKQVQGDEWGKLQPMLDKFDAAIADDLNTAVALTALDDVLAAKKVDLTKKYDLAAAMDCVLGLNLLNLTRADLRIRPKAATIGEDQVNAAIEFRKELRAQQNYPALDRQRDELGQQGVEVMDGDPLGWEWKLS